MLVSGVAAGHPATVDAGIEILEEGGTAADAAVAASLASCVAETVMTGLLGGGHGIYWDASDSRAWNLDCFVAAPGRGAEPREAELIHLEVPFGTELVHYAVGPASCGVPGLPAGLEALWRRFGRLAWPRLVQPALRLARNGVDLPPAHAACLAMLEPVMTMDAGERIYSPGGRLLRAGDRLEQPGLVRALELVRDEGVTSVYRGSLAQALRSLSDERGGLLTRADLEEYAARWLDPAEVAYHGGRVLTTSLGLGSGDFLPGLDLHLNSMLGEADLIRGSLDAGERMGSMMAPTLFVDPDGPALAIGAAGGTRLRTALVGVTAAVVDEGLSPQAAVDRARVHRAAWIVNAEPGADEDALRRLEASGHEVRRWRERHHYFGGVSLLTRNGGAGDPRRSGAARALG